MKYRSLGCATCVLRFSLQVDLRRIFDNALHRHLDELVERVQLLTNQTLLVEIRRDDNPAGLLPQVRGDVIPFLLFIEFCRATE